VFIVALVTGCLIYTLKSKKDRKMKNTIQSIWDDILKKRQFKMKKENSGKDKNTIHSEN